MPSMIDWFAVELKLLLDGKLPASRVETIVKEAEGHLRESAQRKLGPGIDEAAASLAAVEAYGKPDKVALGFLKGSPQRLWGLNPGWWAVLGAVITVTCWNFHWLTLGGYFDNFGEVWQNELAGIVGVLGVVLLVKAIRTGLRSYRLWLTMAVFGAAALSIPLISYWMIPSSNDWVGISRFHLDRGLPIARQNLLKIGLYESYVERGMREYAAAKTAKDLSSDLKDPSLAASEVKTDHLNQAVLGMTLDRGGSFVVPRKYGCFFEMTGGSAVLETMEQFEDAKKQWSAYGPKVMKELPVEMANYTILVQNAEAAQRGKLFFFHPDLYLGTTFATIFLLPFFLLIDWIAALTARPKRRWPRKVVA